MSDLIQKIVIAISFCVLICVLSFFCGALYDSKRHAQDAVKQSLQLVKKQEVQAASTDKIVTKYVDRIQTITKEVPVYVNPKDSACSVLDGSFRVFYDTAASGIVPASTGAFDETPVSVDDLAKADGENLTGCRKNAEQLIALQHWALSVSQP